MSYVEELSRKDAEMGMVRRDVWWTAEGRMMDEEEKARMILEIQWPLERGHAARVENLDHWTVGDAFRRLRANGNRLRDFCLGIRNPYRKRNG